MPSVKKMILQRLKQMTQMLLLQMRTMLIKLFCLLVACFSNISGEGDVLAEVEADDSNVTLACEDDPHKVILCSCSSFFKCFW